MDYPITIVLMTTFIFVNSTTRSPESAGSLSAVSEPMLNVTPRYTSLSGDLDVSFNLTRLFNARMNVNIGTAALNAEAFLTCDAHSDALSTIQLRNVTSLSVGKFAFKCGSVVYGGSCWVKLILQLNNNVTEIVTSNRVEISWPALKLTAPTSLETFTSDISVSLEATGIACPPTSYAHETWLELAYLRHNESVFTSAPTNHRIIADVNDFYKIVSREFLVSCATFDQAGVYQIHLKTNHKRPQLISKSALITVKWSEHYAVAFQSGSAAFPCSNSTGVTVFYQHPKCILPGDKIRVFGRVNVSPNTPAASPFVYNYISEKGVESGRNSVTYPCEIFNKGRYVEYCAKYVSRSQYGAVHVVRSNCIGAQGNVVATDGLWGMWSEWSPCTVSCSMGTKTRHRVCNSPSPSNGGRFCHGHPVQSESCNLSKCPNKTVVQSPVDNHRMSPRCRCGCQLDLNTTAVWVASSSFYCPSATSSWTFVVDSDFILRFTFIHFNLNDTMECLQIRNGQSSSSELLLHETGRNLPRPVVTSLPLALLRYHSTLGYKPESGNHLGFVVKVEPIMPVVADDPSMASDGFHNNALMILSPLHLAALVFCIILVCFTLSLIVQHFWNVIHKRPSDVSPQSPLASSPGSFCGGFYPSFHPVTSTTSISEVSLRPDTHIRRSKRRFQRKKGGPKSASLDSIVSSHVCKSPEDYLRDSKLFQTSTSSLDSRLSADLQDVSRATSPSKLQNQALMHQKQQPLLQKQVPLTPGMTRKLPVATVSPQPARVVSPPLPDKSSTSDKLDKKKLRNNFLFNSEGAVDNSGQAQSQATSPLEPSRRNVDHRKKKKCVSPESAAEPNRDHGNVSVNGVRMRGQRPQSTNNSRTMMASLSEFSLTENDEDNFEYDYYDYGMNIQPGSYLSGQYPSWLPPFLPVQPSPYNLEVPMQHFSLSTNSNPNSRPISDASTYQESSADELIVAAPSALHIGVYNQAQSPIERVVEKPAHAEDLEKS